MRPGLEIAGRYRMLESLGRGGFGEVWKAEDLLRDRRVAVKFLYRHIAASEPLWLSKFRQEARIAARLNHSGVTAVDDFGEYSGQWYLVMEFLAGKDLASEIADHPKGLGAVRAAKLVAQVIRALQVAHKNGIVHRDLKPGNLMMLPGDLIKICDFGIAHIAEASATHSLNGRQIGTPAYMAPEQWLGQPVDHRTDLYAVGSILHTLLTGHPPFPGPSVTAYMGQHLTLPPPLIDRPDIPAALGQLVHSLLSKDPDQRPTHTRIIAVLTNADAIHELLTAANAEWKAGNIEAARDLYRQVIDSGNPDVAPLAMVNLAILEDEQGDVVASRRWNLRAAESGHVDHAPYGMGNMGRLEEQQGDVVAARRWYQRVVESGHVDCAPRAMGDLGWLEEQQGDVVVARRWYQRAIESGHVDCAPRAMGDLGWLEHQQGDVVAARRWYQRVVEFGHVDEVPRAMVNRGWLEEQQGDVVAARRWYQRAVESGHVDEAPRAMGDLGWLEHQQGDVVAARRWYQGAIESGHVDHAPRAMVNRGWLEEQQGDVVAARRWYQGAAESGHVDHAPRAMANLGDLEAEQAKHF